MLGANFSFDLTKNGALLKALGSVTPAGPFIKAYQDIEKRYISFILKRFDKFSKGGGNWRRLRPETIARKRSSAILVDSRIMRLGMAARGLGVVIEKGSKGVQISLKFTNKAKHTKSKLTIADLCAVHDLGLGNVPRRRILVQPDQALKSASIKTLVDTAVKMLK